MSGSIGPQQGNHQREPQAHDSGRNSTPAGRSNSVYTKADALKAFLQVHLTYEASLLTMFNYHRGRLRFLRMPFGAKMSQDVFQLHMDAILEQCPGVIGIHDDIMIFGDQ